jgi:Ca2+-binding RTX toxin-like protein
VPDTVDITLVFSNLAKTLDHLLGDAEVNKTQEAEIQATIKQLNDFEGSINDLIDARIAASKPAPGSDDASLDDRVTALEEGLAELGHIFVGDQGADTGADTTGGDTSTDTISGGAGDDTLTGGQGSDTTTDTVAGGQGDDSVAGAGDDTAASEAADTLAGGQGNDSVQA